MAIIMFMNTFILYNFDVFTMMEGMFDTGTYKANAGFMFTISMLLIGFSVYRIYEVGSLLFIKYAALGLQGLAMFGGFTFLYAILQLGISVFSVPLATIFLALYIWLYSNGGIFIYGGLNIFKIITDIHKEIQKQDMDEIKKNPTSMTSVTTGILIKTVFSLFLMIMVSKSITQQTGINHKWLKYITITVSVAIMMIIGIYSINEYKKGIEMIKKYLFGKKDSKDEKPSTNTDSGIPEKTSVSTPTAAASASEEKTSSNGIGDIMNKGKEMFSSNLTDEIEAKKKMFAEKLNTSTEKMINDGTEGITKLMDGVDINNIDTNKIMDMANKVPGLDKIPSSALNLASKFLGK